MGEMEAQMVKMASVSPGLGCNPARTDLSEMIHNLPYNRPHWASQDMDLAAECERAWFKDQLERQGREAEEALHQAREQARTEREAAVAEAVEACHKAEREAEADGRRAMEEVRGSVGNII